MHALHLRVIQLGHTHAVDDLLPTHTREARRVHEQKAYIVSTVNWRG